MAYDPNFDPVLEARRKAAQQQAQAQQAQQQQASLNQQQTGPGSMTSFLQNLPFIGGMLGQTAGPPPPIQTMHGQAPSPPPVPGSAGALEAPPPPPMPPPQMQGGEGMPSFSDVRGGANGANLPPQAPQQQQHPMEMAGPPNQSIVGGMQGNPSMTGSFSQLLPSSGAPMDFSGANQVAPAHHGINWDKVLKFGLPALGLGLSAALGGKQGFGEGLAGLSQGVAHKLGTERQQGFERGLKEEGWKQEQERQKQGEAAKAALEGKQQEFQTGLEGRREAFQTEKEKQLIASHERLQQIIAQQQMALENLRQGGENTRQLKGQEFTGAQNEANRVGHLRNTLAGNAYFGLQNPAAMTQLGGIAGLTPPPSQGGGKPPVGAVSKAKDGTPVKWNGDAWVAIQ